MKTINTIGPGDCGIFFVAKKVGNNRSGICRVVAITVVEIDPAAVNHLRSNITSRDGRGERNPRMLRRNNGNRLDQGKLPFFTMSQQKINFRS